MSRFILSQFTLNSMDLASSKSNTFSIHPSALNLFEFCGLNDAKVTLRGLNLDTFRSDFWIRILAIARIKMIPDPLLFTDRIHIRIRIFINA